MKYLFLLVIVLGVVWFIRRPSASKQAQQQNKTDGSIEMIQCAICRVHLPANDAITGIKGNYCSQAHRQQHESAS
ncbi:MAG: hypothetical protein EXR35_02120 [Limnohabitans sp.]|nr:hypothetical protein [Limnohabitans sp.]